MKDGLLSDRTFIKMSEILMVYETEIVLLYLWTGQSAVTEHGLPCKFCGKTF